jgi:hypothetical protein
VVHSAGSTPASASAHELAAYFVTHVCAAEALQGLLQEMVLQA